MRSHFGSKALIFGLLFLLCGHSHAERVIPFEYRDGLIWVKVSADSHAAPLNFLLDSGAGASVLDLQAARRLGVKLEGQEKVRRVSANSAACRVSDFHANVAGIPVNQNPLALDLSETSEACSRRIDGLLGQDFFRGRIVEIDFKARSIRLLDKVDETVALHHPPLARPASALPA